MGPSLGSSPKTDVRPARERGSARPGFRRDDSSGSLLDFLAILFRHISLVAVIFLATVLGTVTWMMVEPANYEVAARVMLRFAREAADPRTSLSPSTTRVLPAVRPDINTEAELIKSYALVEQVVVSLGLDKPVERPVPQYFFPRVKYELRRAYRNLRDALDEAEIAAGLKERLSPKEIAIVGLMKGLKVESVRDSSVVNATLTTSIREGSSKILNTLLEAYRERRLAVEKSSREIYFFTNQAAESRQNLLGLEGRLDDLNRKYDVASLPEQIHLALQNVSDTDRAVKDSESQVAASEAQLQILQGQIASEPKSRVINETDSRNAELDVLIQRRDALELQRQKELGKYDDGHPEIQNLDQLIASAHKLISGAPPSVPQSRTTAPNATYLDLEKEALNTNQKLKGERAQLEAQRTAYNDYRARFEALRQIQLAHDQLSREVSIREEAYKLNERNAMEARAAEVLRSQGISSIEIVDPAIDPILPSGIRKIYLLGAALLVGLILSIGAAILSDSLDHSLHTPMDVERYSGFELLGCIGYAKSSKLVPPQGERAMEFAQLGSKLDSKYARSAVVGLFGAGPGSRPEMIAAGVAHTLSADFGRKTLLAALGDGFRDCAKVFGKDVDRLSESGQLIRIGESLDLMYLPGKAAAPGHLAERIRSLHTEFPNYERILIHLGCSPPEMWIAAANLAGSGLVLVVGAESTRREVLERWEHVTRVNDYTIFGTVLNQRRYPIPGLIYRWCS